MLDNIIKKLAIILALCGAIGSVLYFTDLGAFLKGEAEEKVKQKVEEFKKDVKEKLDTKKEEVEVEVEKVEEKIEDVKVQVEDKINDLKKIKLENIIK
jgi:gas vesicle protein|tara:strand:+ start:748 stop:1041 length:294 start_codon:yes stop_codon:yes gene_type:complete